MFKCKQQSKRQSKKTLTTDNREHNNNKILTKFSNPDNFFSQLNCMEHNNCCRNGSEISSKGVCGYYNSSSSSSCTDILRIRRVRQTENCVLNE